MKTIKIGDQVTYRGSFGMGAPKTVEITGLTLTSIPRDKYGIDVEEVHERDVRANRVVFTLSDNHWAYSEQVDL